VKVFDLQCSRQHSFEGWFASEADYAHQQVRGLITCPLCGDGTVQKMLSAPRLNLKASRGGEPPPEVTAHTEGPSENDRHLEMPSQGVTPEAPSKAMQTRLLQAMREVLANSEDVGDRFADQARAMHHGDMAQRSIRGRTSPEVAVELAEEGIDIMPIPAMPGLKETLQ
jgi:hypothetical protein